jgi:hypothetical protein
MKAYRRRVADPHRAARLLLVRDIDKAGEVGRHVRALENLGYAVQLFRKAPARRPRPQLRLVTAAGNLGPPGGRGA